MTVTPVLERAFLLTPDSEVMIPFEFGDPGDPPRAQGKNRKDAKRVTMVEPTPAATSAAAPLESGGATLLSCSIFVPLSVGMIRGRLSGFEKKAKT